MKYHIYKDRAGEYRWYLMSGNNVDKIANSGEGYVKKSDCEHGIKLVKGSGDAEVVDDT